MGVSFAGMGIIGCIGLATFVTKYKFNLVKTNLGVAVACLCSFAAYSIATVLGNADWPLYATAGLIGFSSFPIFFVSYELAV